MTVRDEIVVKNIYWRARYFTESCYMTVRDEIVEKNIYWRRYY